MACVGGSAILLAVLGDGAWQARTTLAVLGGLWGARLALHLWHRVRSEPEDGRYRYLREHCGQPLPGDGSTWARDGGLVTIARQGHTLVVTAYYAANIERHAAQTREMAARQPAPEPRAGGRLAMVDAP